MSWVTYLIIVIIIVIVIWIVKKVLSIKEDDDIIDEGKKMGRFIGWCCSKTKGGSYA